MLVSEFIVCGQTSSFRYCNDGFRDISLICSRAFLVDLHLMVCLCFLVRVHPLHWKAFVKFWGFTLRFVYKDCVVCPWKLQIQCYSQVSWCVWAHAVLCSELINSRWVFLKEIVPCIWRHCEVHVLCVLSVPKNCKFNGVPRFHGMPTYIVLYTALMLVPHSYNGRWVFLRGVYFLHLKGVCEALRVYFEPRDSFKSLQKVSFVFPQNLQRQCCSQVSCMWKHIVLYMHCHWCWYHILYMWQLHESDEVEEDPVSTSPVLKAPSAPSPQQKGQLKNRIVFGLLIGFGCLGIVLAGGWVFTTAVAAAVWVATGEYFDLVQSKAMTRGMEAPPPVATKICSAVCAAMPLMTL